MYKATAKTSKESCRNLNHWEKKKTFQMRKKLRIISLRISFKSMYTYLFLTFTVLALLDNN